MEHRSSSIKDKNLVLVLKNPSFGLFRLFGLGAWDYRLTPEICDHCRWRIATITINWQSVFPWNVENFRYRLIVSRGVLSVVFLFHFLISDQLFRRWTSHSWQYYSWRLSSSTMFLVSVCVTLKAKNQKQKVSPITLYHAMRPGLKSAIFECQNKLIRKTLFHRSNMWAKFFVAVIVNEWLSLTMCEVWALNFELSQEMHIFNSKF